MSKRRRPRAPQPVEPDLVHQVSLSRDPLTTLGLASTLLAALDPRPHNPFGAPLDGVSREETIRTLLDFVAPEASVLLTAAAALSGDEVLRRRVRKEVAERDHLLPRWLPDLHRSTAAPRAAEVIRGAGVDDVLITATLPGGAAITAVVTIDHTVGTVVTDAFVVLSTLDEVVEELRDASVRPLDPAGARARIAAAVEQGSISFPLCRTDTWPAARPLVEWMVGLLPTGGTGYERPRPDRPLVPAGLLAALGLLGSAEHQLEALRRSVGGEAALDALDAAPLPDEPFAWDAVPEDLRAPVGEMLDPLDRCCTELLDVEYRTACRRLLADAVAGDPEIFRRSSRPAATAATICWVAGHANSLFDREPGAPKRAVKDITGHFGSAGKGASTRSGPLLRAVGVEPQQAGHLDLGSPRYLTGTRRARIIAQRDRYRAE
jgi:Domain of unknown function (DUF6398)